LIASTPERLRETKQKILGGGAPPNLYNLPPGCHYVERCRFADDSCNKPLSLDQVGDGHFAMCARMDAVREGWPS
jgi:oligopeptide/dipeptide ABC transporter ATP-binding protein